MSVRERYWPLRGGLNLTGPPITMDPGNAIGALNYEVGVQGGYRRIDGYERYDGQFRPSDATYWLINFDAGDTMISDGDLVGDSASPAIQGVAIADAVLESGTYGGADAAGYIVLAAVNGKTTPASFADDDALYVGSSQVATANGAPAARGASTDALDTTYLQAAIEQLRSDITTVPGSGIVRGVWLYAGTVYAFRDNAGATACVMHKATATGWSTVDLGASVAFTSGGTYEIQVGDTITGAISAETAIVARIVESSGTWAGGDQAGTLYVHTASGAFQAENLDVDANANVATIAADLTATTLTAGGRYECHNANFIGSADGVKMYGADGINLAFEFDGTAFLQITTGMATDAPVHVIEHKKHLFLSFPNGSLQNSALGDPFTWSPVLGASEIATADEIVGLLGLPGDVLLVLNRNRTYILSGTDNSTWVLDEYSDTTGGIAYSVQRVGQAVYQDDRGVTRLSQTQRFGDFEDATLTQAVRPLIVGKADKVLASCIVRDKNQYRIFYTDNTALYVSFDGSKVAGVMPVTLGVTVQVIVSAEDGTGREKIYFGADDGYVYQLDKGPSFDGSAVESFLRLAHNHLGTPTRRKRFRRIYLELETTGATTLLGTPLFAYGDAEFAESLQQSMAVMGGGGYWNVDNWNEFQWSSPGTPVVQAECNGKGTAMSYTFYSNLTYDEPHTLFGATLTYSPLRLER